MRHVEIPYDPHIRPTEVQFYKDAEYFVRAAKNVDGGLGLAWLTAIGVFAASPTYGEPGIIVAGWCLSSGIFPTLAAFVYQGRVSGALAEVRSFFQAQRNKPSYYAEIEQLSTAGHVDASKIQTDLIQWDNYIEQEKVPSRIEQIARRRIPARRVSYWAKLGQDLVPLMNLHRDWQTKLIEAKGSFVNGAPQE